MSEQCPGNAGGLWDSREVHQWTGRQVGSAITPPGGRVTWSTCQGGREGAINLLAVR